MWRSKREIIVAVLAVVVLAGSIGGIVYAQAGDTTSGKTLLARVAGILGIDQQKVEDAFAQAQREMQEEALDNYLKSLVDQGKITQAQADEFKSWWKSRPDMTQYNQQLRDWQQAKPGIPPELKAWQEARPDIPRLGGPGIPAPGRYGAHRFPGGMMRGGPF